MQAPIAGFRFTNCYDLVDADRLHVDSGIFGHIWQYIVCQVRPKWVKRLHAYVSDSQRHCLLGRVATDMTQKGHINSSEAVKAYAYLLPVAFLLLQGKVEQANAILELLSGDSNELYYAWYAQLHIHEVKPLLGSASLAVPHFLN